MDYLKDMNIKIDTLPRKIDSNTDVKSEFVWNVKGSLIKHFE